MATKMLPAKTVDAYIKRCPVKVQATLQKLRMTIKAAAPGAKEVISYSIPGYRQHGMLVFFAAWQNHISFYPAPWEAASLREKMSAYKGSKGTIQFPLDQPLPFSLVTKMVKYRLRQNQERANAKKTVGKKDASTSKTKKPINTSAPVTKKLK
ncbi:MAG TPA: DUF1801 domain-containing protein [Chitinophagaceae bacterium]|nr:DUF1801 domain-containing protein [Chitinophagaceae bacterium]